MVPDISWWALDGNKHIFVPSLRPVHRCTCLHSQYLPASEFALQLVVTRRKNFAGGGCRHFSRKSPPSCTGRTPPPPPPNTQQHLHSQRPGAPHTRGGGGSPLSSSRTCSQRLHRHLSTLRRGGGGGAGRPHNPWECHAPHSAWAHGRKNIRFAVKFKALPQRALDGRARRTGHCAGCRAQPQDGGALVARQVRSLRGIGSDGVDPPCAWAFLLFQTSSF